MQHHHTSISYSVEFYSENIFNNNNDDDLDTDDADMI